MNYQVVPFWIYSGKLACFIVISVFFAFFFGKWFYALFIYRWDCLGCRSLI